MPLLTPLGFDEVLQDHRKIHQPEVLPPPQGRVSKTKKAREIFDSHNLSVERVAITYNDILNYSDEPALKEKICEKILKVQGALSEEAEKGGISLSFSFSTVDGSSQAELLGVLIPRATIEEAGAER